MGFFKSLFKSGISNKPEDYQDFYFRWKIDGQEYGPFCFYNMSSRHWSGPPLEGRFENENIWHEYDYFFKILDNLKASQEQLSILSKYDISVDENLNFKDALKIIETKEEELRKQRAIEKEERRKQRDAEWQIKGKLPATKVTLKKLEVYGIEYSENTTRAEAKTLISEYKERERLKQVAIEEKARLKQIVSDFNKRGIDISSKFDIEVAINESTDDYSFIDLLEELNDLFVRLLKYGVIFSLPEKLNAKLISEINEKIEDAFFDAEDVEEQIKDREFSDLEDEYKIVGKLPKNNFKKFNKEVMENCLQGKWNFERDIISLLKKHFPDIKLKKDEY